MRHPDVVIDGQTDVWRVPMDRLGAWVRQHPELIFMGSRGDWFDHIWRDLWYMRVPVSGGDFDDETLTYQWLAVSLLYIEATADYPKMYREAVWELRAQPLDDTEPPVNGDGLFDSNGTPWFVYQFHGLPTERVLDVGGGESFAIFGWQACARGKRPVAEVCTALSLKVNEIRGNLGLRPLQISEGDPALPAFAELGIDPTAGLLAETEIGLPVTRPSLVI